MISQQKKYFHQIIEWIHHHVITFTHMDANVGIMRAVSQNADFKGLFSV